MAVQPALDPSTWDLYLDDSGDLALVTEGAEVAQHVRQRLDFFQGSWFLNLAAGLPWYQEILGARRFSTQSDNRAYTESFIKQEVLETPGVTRLLTFDFEVNEASRAASFTFRFDTLWGEAGTDFFDISLNERA